MKAITVRFSDEDWGRIRDLAEGRKVPVAEIVRRLVSGAYRRYLGSVSYVDREQGQEIEREVRALTKELVDIKLELRRIGVNFNQIARKSNGIKSLNQRFREVKGKPEVDMDSLGELMARFEEASERIGENLCRIRQ